MRRLLVIAAAASLLTLGAACGGDDSGGGGEPLSQEEFEKRGNEICTANNDKLEAAFEERFGTAQEEPSADEVEAFVEDDIIPIIEGQIEDLRELTPPEDIQEDFETLLDDAEKAVDEVRDTPGEEILSETAGDPFEDINERSTELGLTACAE